MSEDLIDERGRLVGTRINIYNLLAYFFDARATEEQICKSYGLTADQVAAARAFALNNAGTVLARHFELEERDTRNSPDVIEQMARSHARLLRFQEWMAERKASQAGVSAKTATFPSFGQWLAEREAQPAKGP